MLPHYVRHHQPFIECTLSCSKPSCYDVTLFPQRDHENVQFYLVVHLLTGTFWQLYMKHLLLLRKCLTLWMKLYLDCSTDDQSNYTSVHSHPEGFWIHFAYFFSSFQMVTNCLLELMRGLKRKSLCNCTVANTNSIRYLNTWTPNESVAGVNCCSKSSNAL